MLSDVFLDLQFLHESTLLSGLGTELVLPGLCAAAV